MKMHKVHPLEGMEGPASVEKMYPMIHLTELDLPEIKDWEVGKDYAIVLKVTQKEKREVMGGMMEAHFDIKEVGDATEEYK